MDSSNLDDESNLSENYNFTSDKTSTTNKIKTSTKRISSNRNSKFSLGILGKKNYQKLKKDLKNIKSQ